MLAVDVEHTLPPGPRRVHKLKQHGNLPFLLDGSEYSALQAYVLNVQGAMCTEFNISAAQARDVLIKCSEELFSKWEDIISKPDTLLCVFYKKAPRPLWTVRICNSVEMQQIALREKWAVAWRLDLNTVFEGMVERAAANGIPLPDRNAGIAVWAGPAR